MTIFNISKPTKAQVVHSIERVILVFIAVTIPVWVKTPDPFSKAAIVGAVSAGAVAVYQAIVSTTTSL
jgi:hypothetical protein